MPLGIESESEYQQQSVKLNLGDAILNYSDAIIESVTADGELLMPKGVVEIVRSIGMRQPETLIPRLVTAIRDMSLENLTGDDTTIILCQANQSKPSLKNNLLAPFRLLRRAKDNAALEAAPC